MLDENAPVSLYYQLKEDIKGKISSGEWKTEYKLPPERELCQLYGVSRITVRQALDEIEREGYIKRKQGKGTFVSVPKLEQDLEHFYSFSEDIRKMGHIADSKIISFEIIKCSKEYAKQLGIEQNEYIFKIRRLRSADKQPFALETSYIPCQVCPGMTKEAVSEKGLYNTLDQDFGIIVNRAEEIFEAVLIKEEEAGLLDVNKDTAGIYLQRMAYSDNMTVEYCQTFIRGDRFRYKVMLK